MGLAQQTVLTRRSGISQTQVLGAALVAAVAVVMIVGIVLFRSMVASVPSTGGIGSAEWREFRAGERAITLTADPFLAAPFLDFRSSERAER